MLVVVLNRRSFYQGPSRTQDQEGRSQNWFAQNIIFSVLSAIWWIVERRWESVLPSCNVVLYLPPQAYNVMSAKRWPLVTIVDSICNVNISCCPVVAWWQSWHEGDQRWPHSPGLLTLPHLQSRNLGSNEQHSQIVILTVQDSYLVVSSPAWMAALMISLLASVCSPASVPRIWRPSIFGQFALCHFSF